MMPPSSLSLCRFSLLHPESGLKCPLTARIERALSECARSASKKGTSGYPSYSPATADLDVCSIYVSGFVAEKIAYGSYGIVYGSDVPGGDALSHAG